jgi:hypothetical protein
MKLLTTSNTKTIKGEKLGYKTFILHLAPALLSGYNTCPKATEGCKTACLNTAGRGIFNAVQNARIRKTKLLYEDRPAFLNLLIDDIEWAIKTAKKEGMQAVFRLNGTSDIPWEKIRLPTGERNIMERFTDSQFYDYTKILGRTLPANYHLTFSRAENNSQQVNSALVVYRMNVAVVFKTLPTEYRQYTVHPGDENDLRFLDPPGPGIIGLSAKGKAKQDTTGFVI